MHERSPAAGFLQAGLAFLFAAAALALAGRLWGWPWAGLASLHLALVGGASQLVLGAAQTFAAALLATDPPHRRLLAAQRALWPLGSVLVVAGVAAGNRTVVVVGSTLLAATLALFIAALTAMQRRSLQRPRWGIRWYHACIAFLVAGGLLGVELARGASWAPGDLLSAHVTLAVLGWLGTAIVGTLHTFFPTLSGRPLALPRLEGPTFACWTLGVAALAAGYLLAVGPLAALGLLGVSAGALMLVANVLTGARAAGHALAMRARLVAAGQLLLGAAVTLAAALAPFDASDPLTGDARAAIALMLGGWIGLTVAGSLLHLLPMASLRGKY